MIGLLSSIMHFHFQGVVAKTLKFCATGWGSGGMVGPIYGECAGVSPG